MQPSTLAKRGWILLFLLIAVFYLYGLGAFPLVGPDEPRYVEVAREMLARHDLITPTLGGRPWFEKPPLLYWLIMASDRIFGISEYASRFGVAICALLSGLAVFVIGRNVELTEGPSSTGPGLPEERQDQLACWSTLVFLSSAGAIVFARAASFDIVVTMTIAVALACFLAWHAGTGPNNASPRKTAALLFGFYFFVGVSLLAKGLIGIVIPFGVIAVYFTMRREWPARKFLISLLWGLPLATAVAAIWYGPMIARHGWTFIDQFIIQHHFARFFSKKYHHPQPFYFYLSILPLLALPWTIFLISAVIGARHWSWRGDTPRDRLRVFALAWLVMPVAFFSLSESKLPGYILPVLPAVALLVSDRLTRFRRGENGKTVMRLTGSVAIAFALGSGYYALRNTGVPPMRVGLIAIPVVLAGTVALVRPQWRKASVTLLTVAAFSAAAIAVKSGAPVVARQYSVRDLMETAAARGYGSAPVVQLHVIDRTAEFYAAGRLTYGTDGEPIKFEGVSQVTEAALQSGEPILVIVPIKLVIQLQQAALKTEVIGDNGRVALVVARTPHS